MEFLFSEEFCFEEEEVLGVALKMKPRDSGQVDSQLHLTLWPSAECLCEALGKYVQPNTKVLELGAGTGLVGLYAAKFYSAQVTITDGNPEAVSLIEDNIKLNGVNAEAAQLVWGEGQTTYDLVLGSDVM